MEKRHAYRNLKLCSKDCLCLFVCPTGAADTETGQIDFDKCIGCGACAAACPARAITMLPNKMPAQQVKQQEVIQALFEVANQKIEEIKILKYLLEQATDEDKKLYQACIHSNKVVIEDLMREAGYMLPQSKNTNQFLQRLRQKGPTKIVDQLLDKLTVND